MPRPRTPTLFRPVVRVREPAGGGRPASYIIELAAEVPAPIEQELVDEGARVAHATNRSALVGVGMDATTGLVIVDLYRADPGFTFDTARISVLEADLAANKAAVQTLTAALRERTSEGADLRARVAAAEALAEVLRNELATVTQQRQVERDEATGTELRLKGQITMLREALRDALGYVDVSDVRYVWSQKGDQAGLHAMLNRCRPLARES